MHGEPGEHLMSCNRLSFSLVLLISIIRIGPPATFLPDVARHIAGKKYVVVTCHGQPWNSPLAPENLTNPLVLICVVLCTVPPLISSYFVRTYLLTFASPHHF